MIIYIEQVLVDNFIINYFILISLKAVLKADIKKLNIILSSALASVFSLVLPLFSSHVALSCVLKILLSFLIILILKKWSKPREFFLFHITFLLLTCLFGGVCLFLLLAFDKNFSPQNYCSYSLPLGAICVISYFVMIVVKNIFANFYKKKTMNNFVYEIELFNKEKSDKISAFLDSGNTLVDQNFNKPITVVDFYALKNILKDFSITDIILNKEKKFQQQFNNVHKQNSCSLGQNFSILVLEIDRIEIYFQNKLHKIYNAQIGLVLNNFSKNLGYHALLNPNIFN